MVGNLQYDGNMKPLPKIDVPQLCRDLREYYKFTQAEMASKLGCSLAPYQSWEQGRRLPSCEFTAKLFYLRDELLRTRQVEIPLKFIKDEPFN